MNGQVADSSYRQARNNREESRSCSVTENGATSCAHQLVQLRHASSCSNWVASCLPTAVRTSACTKVKRSGSKDFSK